MESVPNFGAQPQEARHGGALHPRAPLLLHAVVVTRNAMRPRRGGVALRGGALPHLH